MKCSAGKARELVAVTRAWQARHLFEHNVCTRNHMGENLPCWRHVWRAPHAAHSPILLYVFLFRSRNGKASWNWRFKFPFSIPSTVPLSLKIQLWDKDIFKWNDHIAESDVKLGPLVATLKRTKVCACCLCLDQRMCVREKRQAFSRMLWSQNSKS